MWNPIKKFLISQKEIIIIIGIIIMKENLLKIISIKTIIIEAE